MKEYFLFFYKSANFQCKAIFVPIALMDVTTLDEIRQMTEKGEYLIGGTASPPNPPSDERGLKGDEAPLLQTVDPLNHRIHLNLLHGNFHKKGHELISIHDIHQILYKWSLIADDSPSFWDIIYGINDPFDQAECDLRIPVCYQEAFYSIETDQPTIWEKYEFLKHRTEFDGELGCVTQSIFYRC